MCWSDLIQAGEVTPYINYYCMYLCVYQLYDCLLCWFRLIGGYGLMVGVGGVFATGERQRFHRRWEIIEDGVQSVWLWRDKEGWGFVGRIVSG